MVNEEYLNTARHRAWAEINLNNLIFNFEQVRRLAGNNQLLCVVKANSYGHGAIQIAKTLCANGATFFAVNTPEEALQLRRHGIMQPILILGMVSAAWVGLLAEQNISLTVGNSDIAERYAAALGNRRLHIHIKIETGLNRIGFAPDRAIESVLALASMPCFQIEGIYSHFSVAEDDSEIDFTKKQQRLFEEVLIEIKRHGLDIPWRHLANSAAIMAYPPSYENTMMNMVRPGMLLCGVNPTTHYPVELRPALSLHTHITQIKTVHAGDSVGYGRTWQADKDTRVATLGIGYADGISRHLSGKIDMLVRGQRAPQIGRIAMDMAMIDVTKIPGVKVGDRVTIIGSDGTEQITVDDFAAAAQTIPNEILVTIGHRVPRVYFLDGQVINEVSYVYQP